MSPSVVLSGVIISGLITICGVCISCHIVCSLCKADKETKLIMKEYRFVIKTSTIIAVIFFACCNILVFIYCLWLYLAYDDTYPRLFDGYPINFSQEIFLTFGKIIVLFVCNARLYYTFYTIPSVTVSKKFYYTMNALIFFILPLFMFMGFMGMFVNNTYLKHIGFSGSRILFVGITSCVVVIFNKKLYKKTMDRRTIRNFKVNMKEMKEIEKKQEENEQKEDEEDIQFEFMRTVTGRSDGFDDSIYVLLDIITRYSLLVSFINLSYIIGEILYYLSAYNFKGSLILVTMIPIIYGSFDAVCNSFCLLLFYSYGDKYYQSICQCNKNNKCKFCALHYCAEKCCVYLAKRQIINKL